MKNLKIIIVCGLPGSGKSTVAEGLATALNMPVLSVDPIESAIIKSGIAKSFETGLAAYNVAEALAAEQLKLNNSVIFDAVSAEHEGRQPWRNLSATYQAKLIIIECICSDKKLHQQRIEARIRNLHGFPEVLWSDVLKREQVYVPWDETTLRLDAVNDHNKNITIAIDYIQA